MRPHVWKSTGYEERKASLGTSLATYATISKGIKNSPLLMLCPVKCVQWKQKSLAITFQKRKTDATLTQVSVFASICAADSWVGCWTGWAAAAAVEVQAYMQASAYMHTFLVLLVNIEFEFIQLKFQFLKSFGFQFQRMRLFRGYLCSRNGKLLVWLLAYTLIFAISKAWRSKSGEDRI